ncbi:MAG: ribosome small subunit-dependent GTPase A [Actinomycetota bacterium]|nr:ribosome small subunit-dependent GTPase A [Actinomycetota bacterium]
MTLEALGWSAFFADAFPPDDQLIPARVIARHHGPCVLLSEQGKLGGVARDGVLPAVGDWVAARPLPGEHKAAIEAVLPRRSAFARKQAGLRTEEQVVAANVDTVFLVQALGHDFNLRRLERYLVAAWESGADPVIVLTKADLAADVADAVAEAETVALGVPVLALSAATGEGLPQLEPYLVPGRTVALLGSSGVGKSTLVNRLAGREVLATQEIRADGRGRHTTSHRELVPLPGGALLLDTPGMRELQLWAGEDSLDGAFVDVAELAARCRFADCAHGTEPGCAVRAALGDGRLDPERWDSYRKLQRELRALAIRQDARLQAEARKERRRFARSRRKVQY